MAVKKFKIVVFALLAVVSVGGVAADPMPPFVKSDLGYLTANKDKTELKPRHKKIFISPRSELPILEDAPEYYIFLIDRKTDSFYCKVLKINRYVMMMSLLDKGKKMYFRGGMESATLPITVNKEEELPVKEKLREGWIAILRRKGFSFPVFIPKDNKNFSFDKQSEFDRFEEKQNAKGLVYHKKKWISKEKFEKEQKQRKMQAEEEARKWKNLRCAASKGFIALKNGKTLAGRIKGINNKKILFSSSGEEIWVSLDDAADIPLSNTIAMGRIHNSKGAIEKLDKALERNKLGEAMRFAEYSLDELEKISGDSPKEYEEALSLLSETARKIKLIYQALDQNSCAIYCHNVFPRDELDYHLAHNHILFRNKIWLEKEQLCRKCKGEGKMACPKCHGLGKIVKNCDKCKNGLVQCHICEGSGHRTCPRCNGLAFFTKTCRNCSGTGYIWEIRTPPAVASPGMTVIRDGKIIFNKPTVIYRPSCSYGRYVQVICPACNGEGKKDFPCKKCGGKGRISCPRFEKCPYCRGLGYTAKVCEKCNGTKKLECNACKGKGFIGKPQEYLKGDR